MRRALRVLILPVLLMRLCLAHRPRKNIQPTDSPVESPGKIETRTFAKNCLTILGGSVSCPGDWQCRASATAVLSLPLSGAPWLREND